MDRQGTLQLDQVPRFSISEVSYLSRQLRQNEFMTKYKLCASTDGEDFEEITSGEWENNKKEKIVKHLKGFKEMLDKQQEEEMISDEAFDHLQDQTDLLIAKWK